MSRLVSEDLSEISSDDQYPQTRKPWSVFQWKKNWKCVVLTGFVVTCLLMVTAYHRRQGYSTQTLESGNWNGTGQNAYWMLIFSCVIFYSLYLMECSYATDQIELCDRNTQHVQRVYEKIERMRNSQPIIWWKATCYHYARRKVRTTRFRRGTYFVSTKVYQERVNSFTSSSTFNFDSCGVKDISNNLIISDSRASVIKFRFSKGFAFSNMASAAEFEDQRSTFFRELRRYDDYMDIHEGLYLTDCPAFDEEILALNASQEGRPWFADPFYYWLCSCCLLSWPFRLVLAYNTLFVHYKVTKLFGTNYTNFTDSTQQLALFQFYETQMRDLDGQSVANTPLWTNTATPSNEFNQIDGRNRFELAPAYSEALLLLDDNKTASGAGTNATFIGVPSPVSSSFTVGATASNRQCGVIGADDDSNEQASSSSLESPPSYEEALNLPLVESLNQFFDINFSSCNQMLSHAQCETRLPNSRTFLSIETSL